MQQIIEQLASDAGIGYDQAKCIFMAISGLLMSRVPALKIVIEDIIENVDDNTIKEHIKKMIMQLQEQQGKESFADWMIPGQNETEYHNRRWNHNVGSELF